MNNAHLDPIFSAILDDFCKDVEPELCTQIGCTDPQPEEGPAWSCPYCGEEDGTPVWRYYGQSQETGYHDVFEGCTLCDPEAGR